MLASWSSTQHLESFVYSCSGFGCVRPHTLRLQQPNCLGGGAGVGCSGFGAGSVVDHTTQHSFVYSCSVFGCVRPHTLGLLQLKCLGGGVGVGCSGFGAGSVVDHTTQHSFVYSCSGFGCVRHDTLRLHQLKYLGGGVGVGCSKFWAGSVVDHTTQHSFVYSCCGLSVCGITLGQKLQLDRSGGGARCGCGCYSVWTALLFKGRMCHLAAHCTAVARPGLRQFDCNCSRLLKRACMVVHPFTDKAQKPGNVMMKVHHSVTGCLLLCEVWDEHPRGRACLPACLSGNHSATEALCVWGGIKQGVQPRRQCCALHVWPPHTSAAYALLVAGWSTSFLMVSQTVGRAGVVAPRQHNISCNAKVLVLMKSCDVME